MAKTSIDWLKKELEDYGSNFHLSLDWNTFDELCEQAKAMEKEQIDKAHYDGYYREDLYDTRQYYNDTYGK
jgi:hypothetical protein